MATKYKTEAQILEDFRVALTNAVNQPEIASTMAEFGYGATELEQGTQLLNATLDAYKLNKDEDNETIAARATFDSKKQSVDDMYSMHRKKAKVIFRNDDVILKQLGLNGSLSRVYVKWIETMRTFYTNANASEDIKTKLARLKITPDDLTAGLSALDELEATRAEYLREVGESQDSTKAKDKAFAELDDWMSEFFAVAKIAMDDNPQLLESLGIYVRS